MNKTPAFVRAGHWIVCFLLVAYLAFDGPLQPDFTSDELLRRAHRVLPFMAIYVLMAYCIEMIVRIFERGKGEP